MTTPMSNQPQTQPEKPANNANIRGIPLPLEELLDFATIDAADVESAAQWWDDNASAGWQGALDVEPTEGNVISDNPDT